MYSEIAEIPAWVLMLARLIISAAMLLAGWRLWAGPGVLDRIVAMDLIGSLIMAKLALLVFSSGFLSYLDVASAIAVITFLATVALARYLENKEAPL